MIPPNVARAKAKAARVLDTSGFCEALNHGYCRMSACVCGCHQDSDAEGGRESEPQDAESPQVRPSASGFTRGPGIYRDLSDADYFGDTSALSASSAKILLGKRPPDNEAALKFGSFAHVVLLEPHRLSEFSVLDAEKIGLKADGTPAAVPTMTQAWKRAVAEAEQDGLTIVAQSDWDRAHAMADAVHAHPATSRILEVCTDRELALYGVHPTGALVRGKLDLYGPGLIADYKTTTDGDPDSFGHRAAAHGFHISAANYIDLAAANGLDVDGFAFINAEKDPTLTGRYRISVVELTQRAIEKGREEMAEACRRWLANGRVVDLPDYGDGFTTVDLPAWAYRDTRDEYQEISA
jgi:hypothetical protein